MTNNNQLVKLLNQERIDRQMSYRQFAEFLGLSHSHVINILTEKSQITWSFAEIISIKLKMPLLNTFIMAGLISAEDLGQTIEIKGPQA